jgi:hypothetical protein
MDEFLATHDEINETVIYNYTGFSYYYDIEGILASSYNFLIYPRVIIFMK